MELEVTKKVRMAIKAKLLELGVHVDEELPDYIMILIANRRTKVQMEEDLGLFLGDNTIRFSNWLYQVLKKLEEVTAAPQTKVSEDVTKTTAAASTSSFASSSSSSLSKKSSIEEPPFKETISSSEDTTLKSSSRSTTKTSVDEDQLDSISSKRKSAKDSSGIKSPVAKKSKNDVDVNEKSTTEATLKKSARSKSPIKYSSSDGGGSSSSTSKNCDTNLKTTSKIESPSDSTTTTKTSGSSRSKIEIKPPSNPPKSVITPITFKSSSSSSLNSKHDRSRSPIRHSQSRKDRSVSPDNDSRSNAGGNNNMNKRRNVISLRSERSRSPISRNDETTIKSSIRYKTSGSNRSSSTKRSRSRSPLARARKSLKSLVAVVKRHNEINASKDEEYNPSRPAVTSSVAKVSSVVHVTERPKRATKQQERGSNNLLVRALADAQKSIIQSKTTTTTEREKEVNSSKQGDNDNDDDDDVSLQVGGDNNERGPSRKFSNQSESKNEKQTEPLNLADSNRKKGDGKKLSVKERLGYRIENRLNNNNNKSSRSLENRHGDIQRQYSDLELETGDFNDEFQKGEGDFKMIVVNVATSKTAKERNVTLEKLDKQPTIQVEEPKRLSIQLNVDSDSDSEDELELQPNDDADFDEPTSTSIEAPASNVENDEENQDDDDDGNSTNETTVENSDSNKKVQLSKDSSSDNGTETKSITKTRKESVNNAKKERKKPLKIKEERTIKKSTKSKVVASDNDKKLSEQEEEEQEQEEESAATNQEAKQEDEENVDDQEGEVIIEEVEADEDEDVDDDEEIEEYEEIEEDDEEEGDYDVVLQENVRLPDPEEYDKKSKVVVQKKLKRLGKGSNRMEADDGDDQETGNTMDTASTENKEILYTVDSNYEMDSEGVQYSDYVNPNMYSTSARYRPINQDTKFVVTMDGNQRCDPSMMMYEDEAMEYMETESYAPDSMDLRHRISRTVRNSAGLTSNYASQNQTSSASTPLTSSHYNTSSRANYLPITGHPPMRPASSSVVTSASTAPACKYWPECTFKDKCVYPHPKCKYGAGCTKPNCPYKHDSGAFPTGTVDTGDLSKKPEGDGKIQCKFFPKCHSMSCPFYHPTPCRFGIGCTNIKCTSFHPGQTVGQKRSQMLPFTRGRHSSTVIPSANLLRWKAPTTNKTNTTAATSSDTVVNDNTDNSLTPVVTA